MENKLHIWIITDEPPTKEGVSRSLTHYDDETVATVKEYLEYEFVGEHLCNCEGLTGSPDIIIMDLSSLSLGLNMDGRYTVLRQFLRKHNATIFHLVCYVYQEAQRTIEEIKQVFKEEDVVLTSGHNGNEAIANYMTEKTLDYFGYEQT